MLEVMQSTADTATHLIRIGSLAELTGVPVTQLRRLADAGLIHACRVGPGHHRKFPRDKAILQVRRALHLLP